MLAVCGLLLVTAVVGLRLALHIRGEASSDQASVVDAVSLQAPVAAPPATPGAQTDAVETEARPPQVPAPASAGFTVAVTPLQQQAADPEAIRLTEAAHRVLLDELRRVPSLVLVEIALPADGDVEPLPGDVRLDFIASDTDFRWRFNVRGTARGGGRFNAKRDARLVEPVDVEAFVADIVERLWERLFPADAWMIAQLEAQLRDWSLTRRPARALSTLVRIAERTGDAAAATAAVEGGIFLAAASTHPFNRQNAWRQLGGLHDDRLVQPLADVVLYDSSEAVRLVAAEALADYADNPVALAALQAAGRIDADPVVRSRARWLALDDAGRRKLVTDTLMNHQLADAERLAPIETDSMGNAPGANRIGLEAVIDETHAAVLAGLVQRQDDEFLRSRVLEQLGAIPALVPLLLERLRNDPTELVRSTAVMKLHGHLDAPGVRAELERARESEPSSAMRDQLTQVLGQ